jgi:hypothetical protein
MFILYHDFRFHEQTTLFFLGLLLLSNAYLPTGRYTLEPPTGFQVRTTLKHCPGMARIPELRRWIHVHFAYL